MMAEQLYTSQFYLLLQEIAKIDQDDLMKNSNYDEYSQCTIGKGQFFYKFHLISIYDDNNNRVSKFSS